jgi:GNAT superfamily N-acetyltransferase
MKIDVQLVEYSDIEPLRDLYRQEANCQIINDSALRRGLATPYLVQADGRVAGYGAVWTKHYEGRLMEFYTIPSRRADALSMLREILAVSGATHMEAQTNQRQMLTLLYDCAHNITEESILFEDAVTTQLPAPDAVFRPATSAEKEAIFPHHREPIGDWVIETGGRMVATGGALYHYNPPYCDLYMEVSEAHRRKGYGSYLVQELKRVCYENGKCPAARCSPDNFASRLTLEKAGFLPCGHLLVGDIKSAPQSGLAVD